MSDAPENDPAGTGGIGVSAETLNTGSIRPDGSLDDAPRRRWIIYAITHIPTGRRYIGQSRNHRQRFYTHKSALMTNKHWCSELQSDWNAGRKAAFSFDILRSDICSQEAAHVAEREEIFSAPSLYNYKVCTTATGKLSIIDERRERQSIAVKAAWNNPNSDLRNPRRRRWDDPNQRNIQSESQKRRYTDPKEREQTAVSTKRGQTAAVRARKSEASKASWADPDSKQRKTPRVLSEEGRTAISTKGRAFWSSPEGLEFKEQRSAKLRAYWADPTSKFRNRKR